MQRKFFTNLIFLVVLNLLIKPFWLLGIDRTVQNVVGAEKFGFYFVVLNVSIIFNILLDFGLTNFNNRNIAQNTKLLQKHFSKLIVLKVLLAIVYTIITLAFALLADFNSTQIKFLYFLAFNQFLLSFILYLRSNLAGLLHFITDGFLSVLDRTLMIIICGILLWTNISHETFKIEWFVYSQTIAYLITAFVALFIVMKKAAFRKVSFDWRFMYVILKQSLPFATLVVLMAFYNRSDSIWLEILLPEGKGNYESGVYASAFRLLDAINMLALLFAWLLLPIFSKMIKLKQNINDLLKLSFTLLMVIAIIVANMSFFYRTEIIELLYTKNINESLIAFSARMEQTSRVFGILMFSFIPIATTYIFGTLLTANGSLKQLNIVAAGGMIISLVLNFLLIPKFFAAGSAIASLTAQTITAIAQLIIALRLFRIKVNMKHFLKMFSFVVIVIVFAYLSKQLPFSWLLSFFITLCVTILVAFKIKILNLKNLTNLVKDRYSDD